MKKIKFVIPFDYDFITNFIIICLKNFHTLSKKEKIILYDRSAGKTLKDIGKDFGVTGGRIRQIEARALKRLRYYIDSNFRNYFIIKVKKKDNKV